MKPEDCLKEVNFRIVDEDIEKVVFLKKESGTCQTLDAMQSATAIGMSTIVAGEEFRFCTFDHEMSRPAKSMKFQTNLISEEEDI